MAQHPGRFGLLGHGVGHGQRQGLGRPVLLGGIDDVQQDVHQLQGVAVNPGLGAIELG